MSRIFCMLYLHCTVHRLPRRRDQLERRASDLRGSRISLELFPMVGADESFDTGFWADVIAPTEEDLEDYSPAEAGYRVKARPLP